MIAVVCFAYTILVCGVAKADYYGNPYQPQQLLYQLPTQQYQNNYQQQQQQQYQQQILRNQQEMIQLEQQQQNREQIMYNARPLRKGVFN